MLPQNNPDRVRIAFDDHRCQGRRDNMPLWRSNRVPPA